MKHRADHRSEIPSEDRLDPDLSPVEQDQPAPADPLRRTRWHSRTRARSLTFVLLVLAAAAVGLAARLVADDHSEDRVRLLAVASLMVAGLWALLTATTPKVVTLRGSVLTVRSGRTRERFDLADGRQQVGLLGEDPRSSGWALVLHRPDGSLVQLGRRDVDAVTLDPLVRQFRDVAQDRRTEQWARLGL